MYGARSLTRSATSLARLSLCGLDDIAGLGGQALVCVLDDCKRAVRAGTIEF